jgi:hypothetical protein
MWRVDGSPVPKGRLGRGCLAALTISMRPARSRILWTWYNSSRRNRRKSSNRNSHLAKSLDLQMVKLAQSNIREVSAVIAEALQKINMRN